jgi:hypothetical protein
VSLSPSEGLYNLQLSSAGMHYEKEEYNELIPIQRQHNQKEEQQEALEVFLLGNREPMTQGERVLDLCCTHHNNP